MIQMNYQDQHIILLFLYSLPATWVKVQNFHIPELLKLQS